MSDLKTKPTDQNPEQFLKSIEDNQKREDCQKIMKLMQKITGKNPKMWGTSIIGFGSYHYKYATGREGDWFILGFSPRKQNLTIYIMPGYQDFGPYLKKLGKHKIGKSCLYINKLADIDLEILEKMMTDSVKIMKEKYETDL